ncbi:MAG TPA: hypothetical protein VGO48_00230 [Conexibacter sp.]|jgi:hypothetical protein|nr:hypothetical protein [Conexibacter sp.]
MDGLRIRRLAWTSAAALLASGALTAGASALAVGVTVPGVGSVEARLPAVQVPSVTVPSITVPSVPPPPAPIPPPPSVQTPSVQTPPVQTPSVQTPSVQTPSAPSVGGVQQQVGSAGTGPAPGPSTGARGTATSAGSGGTSGAPAPDAVAGQGSSAPVDAALRVRRDRIAAGGSPNRPVSWAGAQRRLQLAVEHRRQCLDDLGPGEQRVLGLRAGIGPGAPLTRPQVARRLDLGVTQTGRIERRGLRRLDALAGDGACGGVGGAVATAGPLTAADGGADVTPGASSSHLRPRSGIGGVVAHGGGDTGSDGRSGFDALPPPIGDGGEATLLVALGLLVALALLVRRELSRR